MDEIAKLPQEAQSTSVEFRQMKSEELEAMVLKARDEGKVVMWVLPDQLMTAPVEEFVKQSADGILWDLNRGEECALSSQDSIRWVNDFAVARTIRELVRQRDEALKRLDAAGVPLKGDKDVG